VGYKGVHCGTCNTGAVALTVVNSVAAVRQAEPGLWVPGCAALFDSQVVLPLWTFSRPVNP
jgi:hypothetical protein